MKQKKNVTEADILEQVKTYIHAEDSIALIEKAINTAKRMHEGQFRKSGEPYIIHPFQVGYILAQLQTGPSTICAGLLHDVLEDCDCTREEMVAEFGEEIITLVEAVTNVGKLNFTDEKEYEAVNHRRIFIAMAKDVRVILVKLVDRLHNMRTLEFQPPHKQKKKAEETMAVYAPIAHRLGISEIKNELEDICFYYLNREKYYEIARLVDKKQSIRNAQVNQMIEDIKGYLEVEGIEARVFGRSKHLYSIYKKMTTKNKRFDEILDLLAIRIVTKNETNCYEILGIIHAAYKPIPGRFKDYIAMPKANMYQSLHTTIVGEEGNIFEVQIRTEEMDSVAELGIASHWSYKEGKSLPSKEEQKQIEDKLAWFRDILDFSEDDSDAVGYMDTLKHDIFEANVYVMSPMGRVIDLPNGSTPLDFAYRIHTDVGHQTIGATVNGILVPLNTTLKTGDVVNIRTSKQSNGPSEDWLKIVKSNQAKNKIRSFLAKKDAELKSKYTDKGEEMLIAELKKRGFDEKEYMDPKKFEHIYGQFAVSNYQDFMYAIAVKSLSTQSVIDKLTNTTAKKPMDADSIQKYYEDRKNAFQNKKKYSKSGIMVSGVDSMMIELAGCCSPIPGDDIAGYISKGKGVKVHRKACPNIANEKARLIDVEWDESYSSTEKYRADLLIEASDRNLLLSDIITMTSQCKTGIQSVTAQVAEDKITALVKLTITVDNLAHLNNTIANLKKVESVIGVQRVIH